MSGARPAAPKAASKVIGILRSPAGIVRSRAPGSVPQSRCYGKRSAEGHASRASGRCKGNDEQRYSENLQLNTITTPTYAFSKSRRAVSGLEMLSQQNSTYGGCSTKWAVLNPPRCAHCLPGVYRTELTPRVRRRRTVAAQAYKGRGNIAVALRDLCAPHDHRLGVPARPDCILCLYDDHGGRRARYATIERAPTPRGRRGDALQELLQRVQSALRTRETLLSLRSVATLGRTSDPLITFRILVLLVKRLQRPPGPHA